MRGTFPNSDNPTHPFLVFGYDGPSGETLWGVLHLGTGEEERLGLPDADAATAAATSRALAVRSPALAA